MSIFDKLKSWLGIKSDAANDGDPATPGAAEQEAAPAVETTPRPPTKRTSRADDARIESAARELFDAGDPAAGIDLLAKSAILLAKHDPNTLPCLCKRCLPNAPSEAEALGTTYVRDFVVSRHHVLFYWMPKELLGDEKQVRKSMRAEVRAHLRTRGKVSDEPRQVLNPFTKQPITIQPKWRRRINPFTGKPLP